jgi:hypothetical protein
MLGAFLGRAVITMTAVRIGAGGEPGKVTGYYKIRPPSVVMAITPLPHARAHHPISGFPLSALPVTCHPGLPPAT